MERRVTSMAWVIARCLQSVLDPSRVLLELFHRSLRNQPFGSDASLQTDGDHHHADDEEHSARDGEAPCYGAQAIADPEGEGEAREHETEPRHHPARDHHGDVTEQGPHALLYLETEKRELLIEQPGRFAEELLDQAEDAPTRVGRLGPRFAQEHNATRHAPTERDRPGSRFPPPRRGWRAASVS